ncbi:unnamed protein product [Calicophoron daubneyi]|uniref:E3 ubiquitin-protein ligase Hakai n=1 Tax=Calicophoron daubneyi TaxID=300641 RepID=A0AAV2TLH4_CALDB
MTRSSSRRSSRSRSSHHSRPSTRSRSRSGSDYSNYLDSVSHSPGNDRSRSRSASHSRSASIYSGSRSHSRSRSLSGSRRSGSWSRSRSRSQGHLSYTSRSRSCSGSASRSYNGDRHRSYMRTSSRSRSTDSHKRSRSRSLNSVSPLVDGRDPRDRSKRVKWTNGIWLVGEKAKDVVFHFCDVCNLPVVIYGRLLPCKHVLCYTCAMKLPGKCHRCQKAVQTVERCFVGGIFMCFENENCRRTYLSQRDLQAHIDHRHKGGIVHTAVMTSDAKPHGISKVGSFSKPALEGAAHLNKNPGDVHLTGDPASLLHAIHRGNPMSLANPSSSVSSTTSTFTVSGKSTGLLPLPTSASAPKNIISNRLPLNMTQRPPPLGNFPQLSQFSTPPPLLGPGSVPLPSVINPSIPPPSVPPPSSQSFTGASAVAALAAAAAAAAAAAINVQSKAVGLTGRSESLLTGPVSTSQLQTVGLNLFSTALRNANPTWSQSGTSSNVSGMGQSTNNSLSQPGSLMNTSAGSLNIRRFPF